VDVIVTSGTPSVVAAKQATSVIPIVFAGVGDPIGTGLVASLARPGGNVTGLSIQATDLAGKRLELLREIVPDLHRLATMANADVSPAMLEMAEVQATARALGLEVASHEIRHPEDIAPVFEALNGRADALYVCNDPLVTTNRIRINTLALGKLLPTIYNVPSSSKREGCCPTGRASWTCTGVPPILLTRFCAGRSQPTSRWNSRPSSNW
jgi:putative ABC transport system substrate-binding protein